MRVLGDFTKMRAKHAICAMRASVVYMPMCQRANVPTCQWRTRVTKGVSIFQLFFKRIFQFLNFSIMLNICKLQEYLGNSRKFISRNKELKSLHLQNFIKEMQN